jgi:TM2 domain-containing membrane protein YozV
VSTTDFEQNDGLDALSSEELEEQAFGPDPTQRRSWRRRAGRRRSRAPKVKREARSEPPPRPPPAAVVVTQFCYACGEEVDARAELCPHCGVRQPEAPARGAIARRKKSKPAATFLALGLGGVGAHRFYLGQWKTGLAMLLFCWTFLPVAVGVVDFVRYVLMTDREFARRYAAPPTRALPPARRQVLLGRRTRRSVEAVETEGAREIEAAEVEQA